MKKNKEKGAKEQPSSTFESVLSFVKEIDVNFCRLPSFITNDPAEQLNEESKSDTQKSEDLTAAKQQLKSRILESTFATADNRIYGLEYYNQLLAIVTKTNQSRSIISPLACGVDSNPFVSIEASGVERLRKINMKIKETLQKCFTLFVRDYSRLKYTVEQLIKYKNSNVRSSKKSSSHSSTVPTKSTTSDELIVVGQIRSIIECLNDMIVVLSNNPAKEAFILNVVLFEFQNNEIDFGMFV